MEKKFLYIGLVLAVIGFLGSVATSLVVTGFFLIIYGKLCETDKPKQKTQPQTKDNGPF